MIARRSGMVNEPRDVVRIAREESPEHGPMQLPHARPRQCALDRLARKLMPESQDFTFIDEKAGRNALVDEHPGGRFLADEPALDPGGHHRTEIEESASLGRKTHGPR